MLDQYQRQIEYMRISITDRCNLRCSYCMPEKGVKWIPHESILTFEEILKVMELSTQLGFSRFRITGGEPLVRKGMLGFLSRAARIPGVTDLMLTTNGILLNDVAADLKKAGVDRINISLDTLDAERFRQVTRGGDVNKVLSGIFKALEVGLTPVKLNTVVMRGFNDHELPLFLNLAKEYPINVRFIELMPIGESSEHRSDFVPISEMKKTLGIEHLAPVKDIRGGGPAEYYRPEGYKGSVGFISALSRHFCRTCNRVRLTADGKLRPCLHSSQELDLREVLRSGASDQAVMQILAEAVRQKPLQHHMNEQSWHDKRYMSQIGG